MYVIANIKGFQYKVQKGDKLRVPKYDLEVGNKMSIHEIMLVADEKTVKIGSPFVENAVVEATIAGHDKYDKITVFKKKRRKDYSVKRGHRQEYTELVIDDIVIGGHKAAKQSAKKAEAAKASEQVPEVAAQDAAVSVTTEA
jgi:large subunit ribosomal protein L21